MFRQVPTSSDESWPTIVSSTGKWYRNWPEHARTNIEIQWSMVGKKKVENAWWPQSLGFGTENCWKVFGSEMFRAQILTVFLHALLVKFKALMHFVLKMSTNPRTTFETFTHQSVHHVWCLEKVVLSSTKRFQDILAYILLIFSVCANIHWSLGSECKTKLISKWTVFDTGA